MLSTLLLYCIKLCYSTVNVSNIRAVLSHDLIKLHVTGIQSLSLKLNGPLVGKSVVTIGFSDQVISKKLK